MDTETDLIFLLDPGHGGVINGQPQTNGKRSPAWRDMPIVFEGEFNRAIVDIIERVAPAFDVNCINLVPTKEDWPLRQRVDAANALAARNPENIYIYVSIHANAGGGKGVEVFTSPGTTASDPIATKFLESMSCNLPDVKLRLDLTDGDPDKEAAFFVLTKTTMPAILTENFFMDNEEECRKWLNNKHGRGQIAMAHLAAMTEITKEVLG